MASNASTASGLCVKCQSQPHENWPANGGGDLCQNCWEIDADEAWWDTVRTMDAALQLMGEANDAANE